MPEDDKMKLFADLARIGKETRDFDYIPGRFLQDLASSDPVELATRYVLAPKPTAGFIRLWEEGRLDLTVENVAWRHRHLFTASVGEAAKKRLASVNFDVETQTNRTPKQGR